MNLCVARVRRIYSQGLALAIVLRTLLNPLELSSYEFFDEAAYEFYEFNQHNIKLKEERKLQIKPSLHKNRAKCKFSEKDFLER